MIMQVAAHTERAATWRDVGVRPVAAGTHAGARAAELPVSLFHAEDTWDIGELRHTVGAALADIARGIEFWLRGRAAARFPFGCLVAAATYVRVATDWAVARIGGRRTGALPSQALRAHATLPRLTVIVGTALDRVGIAMESRAEIMSCRRAITHGRSEVR